MQAIVQDSYGSADVLQLREIPRPQIDANEVLVRVHAAGVDFGVWHLMAGLPYAVRLVMGVRKPRNPVRGTELAYFLLTGKPVFEAATVVELCSRHLLEQPIAPSKKLGTPLSADLEALVLACLAKDREARPPSAVALRVALLSCKDAARYDPQAARAWWNTRGAELRRGRDSARREASPPPSMVVKRFDGRDDLEKTA